MCWLIVDVVIDNFVVVLFILFVLIVWENICNVLISLEFMV